MNEKVLDETYCKAGKMDVECFASALVLAQADLIKIIRDNLLEGTESTNPITAELHKLNVYSTHPIFMWQQKLTLQTRQGIILQGSHRYSAQSKDVWFASGRLPNTA